MTGKLICVPKAFVVHVEYIPVQVQLERVPVYRALRVQVRVQVH